MAHLDNVLSFPRRRIPLPGAATFHDLALEWLARKGSRYAAPGNPHRHILHMRALWALTEAELRPLAVDEMVERLLAPRGPLAPQTIRKVLSTGRMIIAFARRNEWWTKPTNPFDGVELPRARREVKERLTLAEARAMLLAMRPDRAREARVMLMLGLRPGELKGMKRRDVDLQSRRLLVCRSNDRDQTKTARDRSLPIPEEIAGVLEEAMRLSSTDLVFPATSNERAGAHQRADAKLSRMLRDALRRAGVVTGWAFHCNGKGCGFKREAPTRNTLERCEKCGRRMLVIGIPKHVTWYGLRHSAATLHREAGCDPLVIQLCLGHANNNLTDSTYTHLSDDYVRREFGKLKLGAAQQLPLL